jgi:ribosomal protein L15
VKSLILHPDISLLRGRIATLATELTDCFDERLRLSFEVLPGLRHRYTELFGTLERKVQERTLAMSERRRMVELFSVKLDRGQKLDAMMVELVLRAVHNEFGRIRSRVEGAVNVGERRGRGKSAGSGAAGAPHEADSPRQRALQGRDLYRRLAKRLHPDLHGDHDPLSKKYWELVQEANMRGDLPLLRTLLHLVETFVDMNAMSSRTLEAEEDRLRAAVKGERAIVDSLKNEEVYGLAEKLKDEEWIAARTAELESELRGVEEEIEKCDRFLAPILSLRQSNEPYIVQKTWEDFVETMYLNNR